MAKENYDDMIGQSSRTEGRQRSNGNSPKGILWIVVVGIAVCIAVIFFWYRAVPPESGSVDPSEGTVPVDSAVISAVEVIPDAPVVQTPVPIAPAPDAADAPVLDNQAKAFGDNERKLAVAKTIQYADHVVEEGEDLNSIAALYGLKTQTIISVNQIRNVQAVSEGSVLRIPDRDGQLYTVREGDMLSTIARRYNPSLGWKTLQELNGLTDENIVVGQKLFIPDVTTSSRSLLADVATVQFQRPAAGTVELLFGQPYTDPATGNTVSSTGILIVGEPGTAVFAAAAGNIVDAGYEARGKGRFVVISHEAGYKTTYAHLENVEVDIGMEVPKGEPIGSIGTSGTDYDKPSLFFSIEQSGIFLDPSQFF
jgi:murein DD-endopeptidase MepM/ murein hydrolase activator NlpD